MTASYIPTSILKVLFSESLTADFIEFFSIQKLLHTYTVVDIMPG